MEQGGRDVGDAVRAGNRAQDSRPLRYTLAAIYRDEMKDNAKAVAVFTQVLEDDPMFGPPSMPSSAS